MANVFGTNAAETINALDGVTNSADTIFGFGGNDIIYGLGGNDHILGGAGADTIYGGSGTDTASYSDSSEGVVVSLVSNEGFGGTAEGDTLSSIENLTGSSHDDFLVGNDGNNVLVGLEDNDILKGGGGTDILYGDSGNDTLKGGGGNDTLNGGSGIDTASYTESASAVFISLLADEADWGDATGDELNSIENVTGSAYNDVLYGNDGVNVLKGMDGTDVLKGYGGADTLLGGDDNDWLYGMNGADTLRGENGHDYIEGGADNDTLDGGAGNDDMLGGLGDDTYYVNGAGDVVTEHAGEGFDTIFASANHTLAAGVSVEVLSLQGGSATSATGNELSQSIFGNALDNILEGGGGAGSMNGMGGNDTFVFRTGQSNGSVVYEFQGNGAAAGDSLKFIGFGTLAEGATITQASATEWIIHSGLDSHEEVITVYADGGFTGAAVHPSDFIFV